MNEFMNLFNTISKLFLMGLYIAGMIFLFGLIIVGWIPAFVMLFCLEDYVRLLTDMFPTKNPFGER